VSDPNDILIYGKAIGSKHDPLRDDASEAELQLRPWRVRWPHYIRVHDAEFLAATLADGVSLRDVWEFPVTEAYARTWASSRALLCDRDPGRNSGNVELNVLPLWIIRKSNTCNSMSPSSPHLKSASTLRSAYR
jgi:hypothetical protein